MFKSRLLLICLVPGGTLFSGCNAAFSVGGATLAPLTSKSKTASDRSPRV